MDIVSVTSFFGWCSVINIGILSFTALFLMLFKDSLVAIHSQLFNLEQKVLLSIYFKYIAGYKVLILMFNLVPYVALKIIA